VKASTSKPTGLALPLFFALLFTSPSLLAYSDCSFQVEAYEPICKSAVSRGVSIEYANRYLLAPQTKERDFKSLRLFSPKMIHTHHANEKRANNALVAFVPQIVDNLHRYRDAYDAAEKRYHVNREVIAAILAKETRLGRFGTEHDAFTVFNTLVRELPADSPRNIRLLAMAENNIVAMMQFCYRNGIQPQECRFKSSYAGAVGIPQFMPQNFGMVESFKGGPGDLDNMEDAIISTARFLNENAGFTELLEWEKVPDMARIENAWYDYDYAHRYASFAYTSNSTGRELNCFACDKPQLAYIAGYVKKIMRYNNSSHYAGGVLRLAYDAHKAY